MRAPYFEFFGKWDFVVVVVINDVTELMNYGLMIEQLFNNSFNN